MPGIVEKEHEEASNEQHQIDLNVVERDICLDTRQRMDLHRLTLFVESHLDAQVHSFLSDV